MKLSALTNKILSNLRIRQPIGGLEISDSNLRFAYFDGSNWTKVSLRLPPGTLSEGRVKDRGVFLSALQSLKTEIYGRLKMKSVNVVVSLGSVNIYSQIFSLPIVEGENLEKAIQLNIQMVSPTAFSETYSGWQMVGRDQKSLRLEILSAFVKRELVDEIVSLLLEAGFSIYSIESRALSITRAIKYLATGFYRDKSYIIISIDNNGVEMVVVRNGQTYFQYFNSWRETQGDKREITMEAMKNVIVGNIQQVVNFYNSHWTEPIAEIIFSATALQAEIADIIKSNFPFPVRELTLKMAEQVGAEWYFVMGSALRPLQGPKEDRDINLLGMSVREQFMKHSIMNFVRFWEIAVPVSLMVMAVAFVGALLFLNKIDKNLDDQSFAKFNPSASLELAQMQKRVESFNSAVSSLETVGENYARKAPILLKMKTTFNLRDAVLTGISFGPKLENMTLFGRASSEDVILALKKDVIEAGFSVDLPLSQIQPATPQGFSFVMSVSANSLANP